LTAAHSLIDINGREIIENYLLDIIAAPSNSNVTHVNSFRIIALLPHLP
jgi:hypothetical protein